ncbi:translocation/assembly module TamB domain-containing protein [Mucilaginibacter sp. PPCGB 2223]|uniref:translocation/assembly module TamB domain-containing protein n=1 Tax=Mucilaginibacter sp. PPCGB 2223 TaxID=1886027 RepID=UPI0009F67613|nr:translocation/assembly module TamB domain-containing protein [Mucilaginibacter sp. PPCGB 2223]
MQTWLAKKATTYLSKELKTTVSIGSIDVRPFSSVVIEDFYVLDRQKDTLVSTPKLTVDLLNFSIFRNIKNHVIDFSLVQLDNGSVYLKKQKDSTTNFKFIVDHFKSTDTTKSTGKPWSINFQKVVLNNLHFRYKNQLSTEVTPAQVNFNDVDVQHMSTVLINPDFKNHLFKAGINNLTLKDKSGFYLKNLTAAATVDTNQILLQHLLLVTNRSNFSDYFRMQFRSFDDFDDFENKVYMDADFKSSRISSLDIAYFTISLQHIFFDIGIDGRIKGPVSSLKAKNLTVSSGQATYVKGDFSLKGLPHWDKTFLELKFEQIATNKKDLDLLYSRFTGTPNRHLPDIVGKFGNVNFSGQFTGFQNDFIAYGDFKTRLGRFNSDINLKFDKNNVPSYSGKLNTTDFDLGNLIDNNTLGRATLKANIKGRGFELKNLTEQLDAKIDYIDFNGYRYNNATLNGTFLKKKFDGAVLVNDRNLNLDFKGAVDLNPKLPAFNFTAAIKGAHLNTLKLAKDTIGLDALVTSNFTGNNLENIEGSILMRDVKMSVPRHDYLIDSVYFAASGKEGEVRQLTLKSGLADAKLKGTYDLASLPDYFKAIAKKYIPSLQTVIAPSKPQNFDFNIQLKNLDPITALFAPQLKLPDQGTFIGKFNSVNKTATLNGLVKTVKYNNIVFHDLLVDESTNNDMLELNLSFSKVNFSDSVFVKDINISNFLKRDSLNFNVKLSDKNAVNQLDLYGLVQFARDTVARLKLLPSDIIIEHQVWKLANQARVRFLDGNKTQLNGFELANGTQDVKIDGIISSDPNDHLKLTFSRFNMSTLNQLSKSFGVMLDGKLNGDVDIASVTGKANMESKLGIDSLSFNKSLIGDIKFNTQLDNDQHTANVKLNVFNRGLETLTANGVYKLAAEGDNLDFDLHMNQTSAAILEPFVKSLVSNLKGTLSSDLKVTGTLSKPLINGTLTFANTGVTVNYLKTPYIVNDKVSVTNSIVNIDNLILKDSHNGIGVANGTVDLSKDLSNPTLNINLKATNLLALNTTFKDNRLYYGTAYGTGDFSFVGPIDNMNITISAKTQEGTVFNIPLNTSSTASDYEFIRYVSLKDTTKTAKNTTLFKGVTLNFDLSADEKTVVKIYTDYGLLTGSGTANNLSLRINSLGDFEMFGAFLITSGKFEFTAKSVISKVFQVNQGGTIRWTGSPNNADINLVTSYDVRANIGDLYQAAGLTSPKGNQYELVQAQLKLSGPLIKPNIDFDFNFPTDASIKDELGTYLNDPTNRSQQALSLIVRRSFNKGAAGNTLTNQVSQTAQDAFSELVFNKFNSVLSQNIKAFDLNLSSAQEASLAIKLFNDRLLINGSLYSTLGNNQLFGNSQYLFNSNFNDLTKDFQAQYFIRKDGRLTATYSYRALNNTTVLNSSINTQLGVQYVNGLGLIYHRDFDTFGEFFRAMFSGGRKQQPTPKKTDTTVIPTPVPKQKESEDDN